MSSAILRQAANLVQDLYIKELKSYKPAPAAKDAHVGAVKAFSLPPKPVAPSLPSNLAAELAAYDAQEPTKAESKPAAAAHGAEPVVEGAENFLEVLEADLPKAAAHH
ncbi:hypothetical protein EIP86_000042 [Pleurotus ostreatoroseus]|nr:hypothetical protein EIP86_000042 [Pleurotus ostreatoroseus]